MTIENAVRIQTSEIASLRVLKERYRYDDENGYGVVSSIQLEQHEHFLGICMVLTLFLGEDVRLSKRVSANGVTVKLQFLGVQNFRASQDDAGDGLFKFTPLTDGYNCSFSA
ncbi:MAG: hypothetical protein K8F25_10485, partial [Fimbriimonadaceae bacterium]|nr:hypothetical protein [Alphaproteobacteria bacterium]